MQEEYKIRLMTIAGMINIFPEKHDQATWICGTTHCVGGYAVNLFAEEEVKWDDISGGALYARRDSVLADEYNNNPSTYYGYMEVDPKENYGLSFKHVHVDDVEHGTKLWLPLNIHAVGRDLLGLTHDEAVVLFNGSSTLEQVNTIIKGLLKGDHINTIEHGTDCECEYCYDAEEYEEEEYHDDEDY